MWPWEHLAFGYVLYSGYTRLRHGHPPGDYPVIVLAVMTQLPDLVDKPLAWSLGVLPAGRSLTHSLFVALAVVTVVSLYAYRRGTPELAGATTVGYLSHLLGDVIYPVLLGEPPAVAFLFWPVVQRPPRATPGLSERTLELLGEFMVYLGSPRGRTFLALELGLALAVVLLWVADGWPGLRTRQ